MKFATWRQAVRLLLVLGLAPAPLAVFSYQGPRLEATYTVTAARPAAGAVSITFAFTLENLENTDTDVERIELGNLADLDAGYATFDGGTLAGRGTIRGSVEATVPQSVFDRWQRGGPATLYVYSRGEQGSVRRTRVDAYRVPD